MSTGISDSIGLVADIGGTHVRFAVYQGQGMLENIRSVAIADYDTVEEAVRDYLDGYRGGPVRRAVFGIANPVLGDRLHMTNAPWSFSIAATRQALNLDHLRVINDFTALALSLPVLTRADLQKIGGGSAAPNAPLGLLGPGTGLGGSALVRAD